MKKDPNFDICKNCKCGFKEHFRRSEYCPGQLQFYPKRIYRYSPMNNLEYLEWCYESRTK